MFHNSNCELITKTKKEVDGISIDLTYNMNLSPEEIEKLKLFRENFGKTSPIHFQFNDTKFAFSQKKYLKKSQFVENPPNIEEIENKFLSEVKITLDKFNNLLIFESLVDSEKSKNYDLKEMLNT
jgi:hypothetical protein